MKIIDLELTHFGKFHHKTIPFHGGLNIIYGHNEAGKSTMNAFIRAMLFGMAPDDSRVTNQSIDDYRHYEPWRNPDEYAGKLRFEAKGEIYRIERSFARKSRDTKLIRESTGEELEPAEEKLRELISPLNEMTFANTISIGQMHSAADDRLADELHRYLADLGTARSAEIHLGKAISNLKAEQANLRGRIDTRIEENRSLIERWKTAENEKIVKIMEANHDAHVRHRQLAELIDSEREFNKRQQRNYEEAVSAREDSISSLKERITAELNRGTPDHVSYLPFLLFFVLALASGALFFFPPEPIEAFRAYIGAAAPAFGVLALVILIVTLSRGKHVRDLRMMREELSATESDLETLRYSGPGISTEKLEMYEKEQSQVNIQLHRGDWAVDRSLEALAGFDRDLEKLKEHEEANAILLDEIRTSELTVTKIAALADSIHGTFGYQLNKEASRLLDMITGGVYSRLIVDEDFNIFLTSEGQNIPVAQTSRGTIDQIYFCIRLAAASLLSEGREPLPLIFDDVFVYYDNARLESTLELLKELPNQIILFTCQEREKDYFNRSMKQS